MAIKYRGKNFTIEEAETRMNGRRFRFDIYRSQDVIVALAMVGGKIVMEKQRRPVIGKSILELPAGKIEKGETPRKAVLREFSEETGYTASRARSLFSCYMNPGILTQAHYYFLLSGIKEGKPHRDRDEEIEIVLVEPGRALSMIKDKRIVDGKSIMLLLWAARNGLVRA